MLFGWLVLLRSLHQTKPKIAIFHNCLILSSVASPKVQEWLEKYSKINLTNLFHGMYGYVRLWNSWNAKRYRNFLIHFLLSYLFTVITLINDISIVS